MSNQWRRISVLEEDHKDPLDVGQLIFMYGRKIRREAQSWTISKTEPRQVYIFPLWAN